MRGSLRGEGIDEREEWKTIIVPGIRREEEKKREETNEENEENADERRATKGTRGKREDKRSGEKRREI